MMFSFQLMHCLAGFMSKYVIIIFYSMRCETFYRFCVSSSPSFFSSDDRSVPAGHVYSALSEEMSPGAGRAITLGIRALGCVVNLGKDTRER